MLTLTLIYTFIGLLFIGLSIPLIRGKVPPNRWYGFRTRLTLESPDVWYPANDYAGWWLLAVGIITTVAALVGWVIPGLTEDGYVILVTIPMLGSLLLSAVFCIRYAKSLVE